MKRGAIPENKQLLCRTCQRMIGLAYWQAHKDSASHQIAQAKVDNRRPVLREPAARKGPYERT